MEIGPTMGQKLQQDALITIAISMMGIVVSIAVRFDLRFGVAAAVATLHDVLAVLGIFFSLDKEITLLVVTALLTLAGYFLTDTVVIFDRIRENLRARRQETFERVINTSINQVLSRTVVVSLTVILVLIPLAASGAEVLHDFSSPRCWGASSGRTHQWLWPAPCSSSGRHRPCLALVSGMPSRQTGTDGGAHDQ